MREIVESVARQLTHSLAPLGFGVKCTATRETFGVVLKVSVTFSVSCGPPVETCVWQVQRGFVGHETEDWAKWYVQDVLHQLMRDMAMHATAYVTARPDIKLQTLEWK